MHNIIQVFIHCVYTLKTYTYSVEAGVCPGKHLHVLIAVDSELPVYVYNRVYNVYNVVILYIYCCLLCYILCR